ncbi:hypothetical protein M3Y98_00269200 [Aphelenchoides besseyi]|nr:hypothetical protein M3Y98_00269200 [Aphelenchoides besseyi]KAI6200934.1 hypothetical protein M3Y96_00787400 [Aphelenchoides besseyi]
MNDVITNLKDRSVQSAIKNLLVYSITILIVPLGSMFLLKMFVFEGLLGYDPSKSMMISAVVAVVLVHVILAFWIVAACKDDNVEKEKKED